MKIKLTIFFSCIYLFVSFGVFASLEVRLKDKWVATNLDVDSFGEFEDYLVPNELYPYDIKPHLDLLNKNGLLVATGTERSFIAFALCDKCTGLVGVDINPRVKAFNDFNTFLLKISSNREEYLRFRGIDLLKNEILDIENYYKNRLEEIKAKVQNYKFSNDDERNHYLSNIDNFARIFFNAESDMNFLLLIDPSQESASGKLAALGLARKSFQHANYLYEEALFFRLKKAATEGNLIFTVGDINNLKFLDAENIAAIDASNISSYVPLTYETDRKIVDGQTRIIWTRGQQGKTEYFSYIPRLKTNALVEELDLRIKELEKLIKPSKITTPHFQLVLSVAAKESDFDNAPLDSSVYHKLLHVQKMKL